ncbi:MAG TPA: DeoR/GlpR family DNA-binding transcription regulator, partial [Mycobacteriales bacterium]|nr:DeoR/GlpR family DNA-binding transcription regulator [Mycobacteriales bacterium]
MNADSDGGLRYGGARARADRLLAQVREQGFCTIAELARQLGVSEMTVRRDVARLAAAGELRAVHGGVSTMAGRVLAEGTDYRERAGSMAAAKRAIAAAAVRLVTDGSTIAIDTGTTALELARLLPEELAVSVVTPSLPVMVELLSHPGVQVHGLGGDLHPVTQSFAGPATVAAIGELRVERLFLAANGIRGTGVYCGNGFDAVVKRALIDIADEVVLLADSSKFQTTAMVR